MCGGGLLRNQHIQWGRHTDNLHYLMKLFYFLYSGCWMSVNILVSNTSAPPLSYSNPKKIKNKRGFLIIAETGPFW